MIPVFIFMAFLVIQRIGELVIARTNERKMKQLGAIEVGENHYYLFIILHVAFFLSLCVEVLSRQTAFTPYFPFFLWTLFIITQAFRMWCIQSLGMFWNTKIIVLPDSKRINRGPYRFMAHPNYVIVGVELCIIPLLVQAYMTAIIFPLLHILLLCIRIPAENEALRQLDH